MAKIRARLGWLESTAACVACLCELRSRGTGACSFSAWSPKPCFNSKMATARTECIVVKSHILVQRPEVDIYIVLFITLHFYNSKTLFLFYFISYSLTKLQCSNLLKLLYMPKLQQKEPISAQHLLQRSNKYKQKNLRTGDSWAKYTFKDPLTLACCCHVVILSVATHRIGQLNLNSTHPLWKI